MRRISRIMRALALLALPALAEDVITFHDVAVVKGPKVLLGDVATVKGENADMLATLEVMPAPQPGDTRRMNTDLLMARLRTNGVSLESVTVSGSASVSATTLSLDITGDMLAEKLRQYIEVEMPWDPAVTEIDVPTPSQNFIVPEGELEIEWEANPQYNFLGTGAFRGRVLVDSAVQKTILCKATIETYRNVLVAASDIPRGQLVKGDDVQTERRALSALREMPFESPGEVVGLVAKSTIFPGQMITKRKVELPTLVRRNQVVLVETGDGGLRVQARAIAQNSGAAGDAITCMNPTNKELFQGVVRSDGTVMVR